MTRSAPIRVVLAMLAAALPAAYAGEPEDELRAATVLAFLRHAEWSKSPPGATLTLGVMGRAAMVRTLRRALDGKPANNRTIHVQEVQRPNECVGCQALYVAVENRGELKQSLAGMRAEGLLVIGESDRLLDCGGAVTLLIVEGHMSFEVSQEALDRSGIAISSKLLRYGQVRGRGPG